MTHDRYLAPFIRQDLDEKMGQPPLRVPAACNAASGEGFSSL